MFGAIGTFVYRMRYSVIAAMVVLMAGLGIYGLGLGNHLSQSGWFDPTSQSSTGSVVADTALGRDHRSDVILLMTPPEGTTVDDEAWGAKVEKIVDTLLQRYPDVVQRASNETDEQKALLNNNQIIDPFYLADDSTAQKTAQDTIRARTFTPDKKHAFISIGVAGNDDTTVLDNYQKIEPLLSGDLATQFDLPGTTFQLAGLQPVAGAMASGMDDDIHRAEIIALPLVALMLFFIFGGVIAACLPVFIGGLTIAGSLGIMTGIAQLTELNIFAQSVVTLIGLGIAIDYGLFIVSRFREELAEGYTTKAAVRRTVMTSGQTVVFSATIIVAAIACLLIMPQGFLKSVAYGAIASVSLAAILSITVLPALLAILGPRVDALSLRWMLSYTLFPIVRKFSASAAARLDRRVADVTGRTKSREEIENGFWGKLSGWVMKHPVATAVPTVLLLLLLTIPFGGIKFGGISEKYLPPNNTSRVAQQDFDNWFPTERTEEIKLVIMYDENDSSSGAKIAQIADDANKIPGFTKQFSSSADSGSLTGTYPKNGMAVIQMSAGLQDRDTANQAIKDLRAINKPEGITMWVAGTPALTQDSIDALLKRLPLMTLMLVLITGLLMFLAFGSVVLPIKAALMSALGLGATLGILTWIFVDGHGSGLANFTPGPLFAAILVLIIAIVFGLSTDYEIFLLSRMVEARQKGASTTEAIRVGTALTGRIITAAAAILVVVTGAFGLSEIVMMKYIAYGMIAALILDATIIRMLLVPSVMKLLGDDCWWAPRWMRVVQRKIGLGETILDEEPGDKVVPAGGQRSTVSAGRLVAEIPTSVMATASAAATTRSANAVRSDQSVVTPATPGTSPASDEPTAVHPRPTRATPTRVGPADRRPMPPRPYAGRKTSESPDTGSWRLGSGGISLNPTAPKADHNVAPRPQPSASQPVSPQQGQARQDRSPQGPRGSDTEGRREGEGRPSSPMTRRPQLNDNRPLAASVSPEASAGGARPAARSARTTASPMDRGLSPDPSRPLREGAQGQPDESTTDAASADRDPRPGTDRHARDDANGSARISVQDLLRRSRSGDSGTER